uniref:Gelsolin-like domain-containing protein n=1 Tax=Romanomermis culicivorax TaxID=13658 RepID=A0A915J5N3_ROMCU
MILDNGDQIFLWCGVRASEVEVKLAYKAAQVYIQNLRLKQPDRPRKLCVTLKGKESKRFTKCFHAWSKHKVPAGD